MAKTSTLLFDKQEAHARTLHTSPSYLNLNAPIRMVHVEHTIVTADATATAIKLCYPRLRGQFIPALSRVTDAGGGGDVDVDIIINKVNEAGTAVALSGSTSVDNDSVAFAHPGGLIPTIDEADYLEAAITVTALVAAGVLVFDLAFACADAP